jgi:hypothetical protein
LTLSPIPLEETEGAKLFPKLLAGEEVRSEELEARRADGEQVWVSLSFKPIRDAQGQVIADRSQVEDITARKRLEEALQRYSEKLQELVDERTAQLRQSEERQRALLEINNAIISNLDRDSLFEAIAKTLRSILSFDRLSLSIYDPVNDLLKGFAVGGSPRKRLGAGINIPRQGSMMGRAVDQNGPHRSGLAAGTPQIGGCKYYRCAGRVGHPIVPHTALDCQGKSRWRVESREPRARSVFGA